jgi:5,10-methylenetetrahydromethanopterin reductase
MDISCAFPPVPDTPAHIALAEELGYKRAWAYDTPALQLDVWVTLCRAAERTERIELGPAVLIPNLRHVVATAAAIATLYELAPGRVNVAMGSGFTGRLAMGQRPLTWDFVATYARQLRGLLDGEAVEVDGAMTKLLHGPGQAPARPIRVPFLFGIGGPKGEKVARELGDGIFVVAPYPGFEWSAQLLFGTVLDPGESPGSERALAAAGPGASVFYHAAYDHTGARGLDISTLPGGTQWQEAIEQVPARERHLHTHEGHLTFLNEIDTKITSGEAVAAFTFTGEAPALRDRLKELEAAGTTEIAFQPMGDIPRELRAFADMAGIA